METVQAVKTEHVAAFAEATVEALEMMAMIQARPGDAIPSPDSPAVGDISAVVGLAGDTPGSVAAIFPKDLALELAGNMLGEKVEHLDESVQDALGEIANMIAGGAKGRLSRRGVTFTISIPTVVVGDGHRLSHSADMPMVRVPFSVDGSTFAVEVCLKPS